MVRGSPAFAETEFSGSEYAARICVFFCIKEKVLLNTTKISVLILHFLNKNSNIGLGYINNP